MSCIVSLILLFVTYLLNVIDLHFFDTLDKKERQRILQTVFGTNKPVIYNPDEHYAKLSIDPADV